MKLAMQIAALAILAASIPSAALAQCVPGGTCPSPGEICTLGCSSFLCGGAPLFTIWVPNGPASAGTACGNPNVTECSDPDACDGAGACLPAHLPVATPCGDVSNECTLDACDGGGGCVVAVAGEGTLCGERDPACSDDRCDGFGQCRLSEPDYGTSCVGGGICFVGTCADVFYVDTLADEPDASPFDGLCESTPSAMCSLRAAVEQSNSMGGTPQVASVPPGVYALGADGSLASTDDLLILGSGAGATVIDGVTTPVVDGLLSIGSGATLGLADLTVTNSVAAGVYAVDETAFVGVERSVIRDNMDRGVHGVARIHRTEVLDNQTTGDGGGLYSPVPSFIALITESTFARNAAGGQGGAFSGTALISGSSFLENEASSGGAIHTPGFLVVVNSTLDGNVATISGGGVEFDSNPPIGPSSIFAHVTISDNLAPSGTAIAGVAPLQPIFLNTIVTGSFPACSLAPPVVGGSNMVDAVSAAGCGLDVDPTNLLVADPGLGSLSDLGGPTAIRPLLPTSPGIDAGTDNVPIVGLDWDQRGEGYPRAVDGDLDGTPQVDIGTHEVPEPGLGLGLAIGGLFVCAGFAWPRFRA